jgi:anion-transporting  ArsA/GET3 family ATPase
MSTLDQVIRSAKVIVCVGSGGVGKTTTSSVVAMQAALLGKRTLVMTVDPARRLANALGLSGLDEDVQRIDLTAVGYEGPGELHATMLDMKRALDDIVDRHAPDAATREAILSNRFYHYFSTSLAGAQELSASERLYQEAQSGRWDLIVLDTPPTSNALDFLDAPLRFYEALDSAALQWIIEASGSAARKSGSWLNVGTQFVTRVLGRFTGAEFFEDLAEFLTHFSTLFEGFHQRTRATSQLFADPSTRFLIITSPDPMTVREALYFRGRLDELHVSLGAVIVNRVRRGFDATQYGDEKTLVDALMRIEGAALEGRPAVERLTRKLITNAHDWDVLAARDVRVCADLAQEVTPAPVLPVPLHAGDVYSLDRLDALRRDLSDATPVRPGSP